MRRKTIKVLNVQDPLTEEYTVVLTMRSVGSSNAVSFTLSPSHQVEFDDDEKADPSAPLKDMPAAFAAMARILTLAREAGMLGGGDESSMQSQ